MAAKTIQIDSFCGGTSKLADSLFLGREESKNCYPETIEATDTFSRKILKSVGGLTSKFLLGTIFENEKILKIYTSSITAHGNQSIFIATSANVYSYSLEGDSPRMWYAWAKDMTPQQAQLQQKWANLADYEDIEFCETSGDPAFVIVRNRNALFRFDSLCNVSLLTNPTSYITNEEIFAESIAFLNYRIVVSERNSDYIYWSELNKPNGTDDEHAFQQMLTRYKFQKNDGSWVTYSDNQYYPPSSGSYVTGTLESENVWMGALNNVKVDFKADNVVGICSLDEYLLVFGSRSYQVYQWQNNTYCPYITTSKTSAIGCKTKKSIATINNNAIFLGAGDMGENAVFVVNGSGIEKISTDAISQKLHNTKHKDECVSFAYNRKGHTFYVLSFTNSEDDYTICYDITEKVWHNRCSLGEDCGEHYWKPTTSCTFNDDNWFAFKDGGSLMYSISESAYKDSFNGSYHPLVRERTTGIKLDGYNNVIVQRLELIAEACVDVDTSARIMLQVSKDGGYTWGNELWKEITIRKNGAQPHIVWNGLGTCQRLAFRLRMTDNAPFTIATALLTYTPCGGRFNR